VKRKNVKYFIFLLFFLYLFVVYNTNFVGPDQPIYFAYTASVVEDGDLNIVNHLDPKDHPYYFPSGILSVSKTYNLPDFHNHGGVLLWIPFYVYAKFIYFVAIKFNLTGLTIGGLDKFVNCAMSFSTIVFGFFAIFFTYKLCRVFFSNNTAVWSTVMIFLGTPFFYFTLHEVGNAQMVACLFSILSIWFCSYAIRMKKLHWFLYGLFFSICMIVKVDLCFQIFFIFFLFIVLLLLKQTIWRNGICFLFGLLPMLMLKIINDYIKYGTFHIGEFGLLNFKDFYLFEQLFSSYRGFFYTSPIFYICLLGFVFLVINLLKNIKSINEKKWQDLFFLILSLYLFIKIFILSYRYAWGGGTPGARILLTEFPIFVLLYARALRSQRKYLTHFIGIASVFFILWNLFVVSEYMTRVDLNYIAGAPGLSVRIKTLKYIFNPLFYIKDLDLKLRSCLPLVLIVLGITFYITGRFAKPIHPSFWYMRNQNKGEPLRVFSLFTIYLCIAYTVITLLNVYNNGKNVERLKADGFFENAQIMGPCEFEKPENVGSMNEMIRYFKLKGNIDRVNKIRRHKKEIYGEDG